MVSYEKTFEWLDFPEGRIRYAGGSKGRDEPPIDVFAVELGGGTYYGEIRKRHFPDGNLYNLEIISFGWRTKDWFGSLPEPSQCAKFTHKELEHVQAMVCNAVTAWQSLEERPIFLTEFFAARFMGEVIFRDGWALVTEAGSL